jgi:radical SAM protein with 4Fe4S-binding SPASM domain
MKNKNALRVLAWESTRACTLACPHCRASAVVNRDDDELSTQEAIAMLESAAQLGSAIIILSGGEPLLRDDLEIIAKKALELGHRPVVSCNDGSLLTDERLASLKEAGIRHFSFSMHSEKAQEHDDFVRVAGTYKQALAAFQRIKNHGMSFQINTTILPSNFDRLEEFKNWVVGLGASAWHLFFIVPMGRAAETGGAILIGAEETEQVLRYVALNSDDWEIPVKVTCAPQYSRIRAELLRAGELRPGGGGARHPSRSCMAGAGFVFVSYRGEVKPCGYFSLVVGNVRERSLADIYENSPILEDMRTPEKLEGICDGCPYNRICGGCRARSYAETGNYMAGDTLCQRDF